MIRAGDMKHDVKPGECSADLVIVLDEDGFHLPDGYEPDDPKVWETYDWDLVRDMERGK